MKAAIRTGWTGMTLTFSTDYKEPVSAELGPEQVLVNVKAAAINPVDYKVPKAVVGPVYGLDFSGTVSALGSAVTSIQVGDDVFGRCKGSLAEKSIANEDDIFKKPSYFSFEEAAALGTAYLSGIQALRDAGGIEIPSLSKDATTKKQDNLSVLVIGASGGCGIAALQLLSGINATNNDKVSRVIAICSGRNSDFVRDNGATEVVDYTNENELSTFFTANEGKIDCVYDCSSGSGGKGDDYFKVSQTLLKADTGKYVALNGSPWLWMKSFAGKLEKNQSLILTKTSSTDLGDICELLQSVEKKPHFISKPFTEDQVKEAFQALKSRRAKGKIVLTISD